MFQDTVTIFNKYEDNLENVKWYPTVLHNVELQVTQGSNIKNTGLTTADKANLHIRNDNSLEKAYSEPKAWLKDVEMQTSFTLKEDDFFVKGEFPTTVVNDEEYVGGFFQYMNKKHDNIYRITTVDTFKLIPHWEVGGK